jgi:DNA topoisomerase-1
MRTVASQMRDATGMRTNVRLQADAGPDGAAVLTASGRVIQFPGFLRAYVEGSDDPEAELDEQERILPALTTGQRVQAVGAEARGHDTQPPARYTEASLIRELEERGIGRPSTYASIIGTIQDRGYAQKRGAALVPTFLAFAVVNLLEQHFPEIVDLDFTAKMEEDLDAVADGQLDATPWLRRFYFGDGEAPQGSPDGGPTAFAASGLRGRIGSGWEEIDAREVSSIPLGVDDRGRVVAVRVGRYGPYIQAGDDEVRANIADDLPPDEIDLEQALHLLAQAARGDQPLGTEPESGLPIYLKTGRYGPYVQVGPDDANDGKPRRASVWPTMDPSEVTQEQALMLLSFPKTLGVNPANGEPVTVQDGPLGPYVKCGTENRSLRDHDHLASIDLDEALVLLAEPRQTRGRRGSASTPAPGQRQAGDRAQWQVRPVRHGRGGERLAAERAQSAGADDRGSARPARPARAADARAGPGSDRREADTCSSHHDHAQHRYQAHEQHHAQHPRDAPERLVAEERTDGRSLASRPHRLRHAERADRARPGGARPLPHLPRRRARALPAHPAQLPQ